jgi:hypothetical protein
MVPLVVVTSLLLAGYFALVLFGLFSPSSDPQRGMANGFLMFVAFGLAGMAGLVWFGARSGRRHLVIGVLVICLLPTLSLVARVIYLANRWWRDR